MITSQQVRRVLTLFGVLWAVCILCTGCGSVDVLFTTAEAIVSGIGIVIAALGNIIPAPIAAAINASVALVAGALAAVKTAYDNYKADPTNGTLLTNVMNALSAVKDVLPQILASLGTYVNSTLSGWIENLVNAVTIAIDAVVSDIQPAAAEFIKTGKITKAKVTSVNTQAKNINDSLKAAYLASLSVFPANVQTAATNDFKHKTQHYVGPIHV